MSLAYLDEKDQAEAAYQKNIAIELLHRDTRLVETMQCVNQMLSQQDILNDLAQRKWTELAIAAETALAHYTTVSQIPRDTWLARLQHLSSGEIDDQDVQRLLCRLELENLSYQRELQAVIDVCRGFHLAYTSDRTVIDFYQSVIRHHHMTRKSTQKIIREICGPHPEWPLTQTLRVDRAKTLVEWSATPDLFQICFEDTLYAVVSAVFEKKTYADWSEITSGHFTDPFDRVIRTFCEKFFAKVMRAQYNTVAEWVYDLANRSYSLLDEDATEETICERFSEFFRDWPDLDEA